MNTKKKPVITEEQLGYNPFVKPLVIKVRSVEFKGQYRLNEKEELYENVTGRIEYGEVCKFYCSADRRNIRSKLSPRACQMVLWIMNELRYSEDFIWMNKNRYMREHDISSVSTYKGCIDELIRYGHITPTLVKDVYWINPDFMFKGDRIKKYPKNLEKVK